mmetsp:Transcript_8669/g.18976  ORF Transcript_8669/g.18976 Transcript_8669/m.18976 type:complete len:85 (-) Transcript_8669:90-344(-)
MSRFPGCEFPVKGTLFAVLMLNCTSRICSGKARCCLWSSTGPSPRLGLAPPGALHLAPGTFLKQLRVLRKLHFLLGCLWPAVAF